MRHARVLVLFVLLAPTTACHVVIAGTVAGATVGRLAALDPGVSPGNPVEAEFANPRDLAFVKEASTDSIRFKGATIVLGRVHDRQGDTVWIAASAIRGKDRPMSFNRWDAPVLMFVPERDTRIRSLKNSTSYVIAGGLFGGFIAFVYAAYVTLQGMQ